MRDKAIILMSGGLDSATCLAAAKNAKFDCYGLTFDYGQRMQVELRAARNIATELGAIEHRIVALPLKQFGGSALTDQRLDVPSYEAVTGIPITYVPARNTIFLAMALSWAEVLTAQHIFIGLSAADYASYPDARPAYIDAFQRLADLATRCSIQGHAIRIHTPLIKLNKAQTIMLGKRLGVDYAMTVTCYTPTAQAQACGRCESCVLRQQGFRDAGIDDPTSYISTAR